MFDEANAHRALALRSSPGSRARARHSGAYTFVCGSVCVCVRVRGGRVRVRCRYTLQDTLRRRVFTYQSDDGLSRYVEPRYPPRQTARTMARARGRGKFSPRDLADLTGPSLSLVSSSGLSNG